MLYSLTKSHLNPESTQNKNLKAQSERIREQRNKLRTNLLIISNSEMNSYLKSCKTELNSQTPKELSERSSVYEGITLINPIIYSNTNQELLNYNFDKINENLIYDLFLNVNNYTAKRLSKKTMHKKKLGPLVNNNVHEDIDKKITLKDLNTSNHINQRKSKQNCSSNITSSLTNKLIKAKQSLTSLNNMQNTKIITTFRNSSIVLEKKLKLFEDLLSTEEKAAKVIQVSFNKLSTIVNRIKITDLDQDDPNSYSNSSISKKSEQNNSNCNNYKISNPSNHHQHSSRFNQKDKAIKFKLDEELFDILENKGISFNSKELFNTNKTNITNIINNTCVTKKLSNKSNNEKVVSLNTIAGNNISSSNISKNCIKMSLKTEKNEKLDKHEKRYSKVKSLFSESSSKDLKDNSYNFDNVNNTNISNSGGLAIDLNRKSHKQIKLLSGDMFSVFKNLSSGANSNSDEKSVKLNGNNIYKSIILNRGGSGNNDDDHSLIIAPRELKEIPINIISFNDIKESSQDIDMNTSREIKDDSELKIDTKRSVYVIDNDDWANDSFNIEVINKKRKSQRNSFLFENLDNDYNSNENKNNDMILEKENECSNDCLNDFSNEYSNNSAKISLNLTSLTNLINCKEESEEIERVEYKVESIEYNSFIN